MTDTPTPAVAPETKTVVDDKQKADHIIRQVSVAFLDFRKQLNSIISPELGVIDDMILTWRARHTKKPAAEAAGAAKAAPESNSKEGDLHIDFYTKVPPTDKSPKQDFESFTINSKITFPCDIHPLVAKSMEEAAAAATAANAAKAASDAIDAKRQQKRDRVTAVATAAEAEPSCSEDHTEHAEKKKEEEEPIVELCTPGAMKDQD